MKFLQVVNDDRQNSEILIDSKISYINTTLLVKVNSIQEGSSTINVQPLSKRSYLDENQERQYIDFPNIDLRIIYQKGFTSQISAGDYGMCLVCQSDIDAYLDSLDYSDRRFDIIDGLFMPITIGSQNTTEVVVSSENYISVKNNTNELFSILKDTLTACAEITVNTDTGVLNAGSITAFNNAKAKIETFIKP